MDINQDGVVTIDEFIDCCQKVMIFNLIFMFSLTETNMQINTIVDSFGL